MNKIEENDSEITIYSKIDNHEYMEFVAEFNDCLYIGSGGYEYGIIETKEELDRVIKFLNKNRELLK